MAKKIYYHIGTKNTEFLVDKQGLKPLDNQGATGKLNQQWELPTYQKDSVYLFKDKIKAKIWAEWEVKQKLGKEPIIYEVKADENKVSVDKNITMVESYVHKGDIPKEDIKKLKPGDI